MPDDVVIRISAKDLSKKSFQDAIKNVAGVGDQAEKTKKKTDGLGLSFTSLVAGVVTATAVTAAARKAWDLFRSTVVESIELNAIQERAVNKLNLALERQGTLTPELSAQYQQLASDLQGLSIHGDEALLEMQALLIQVGDVGPAQMERALQATIDLAAGLDRDLRTAAEVVAKAMSGNVGALKEYGIEVPQARLAAEGLDAVLGVLNEKFGGQAQAQIEDYAGKVTQLNNSIGDAKELFGQTIESVGLLDAGIAFLSSKVESGQRTIRTYNQALDLFKRALDGDQEALEGLLTTTTDQVVLEGQLEAQTRRASLAVEAQTGSVRDLAFASVDANLAALEFEDTNRELIKRHEEAKAAAKEHAAMVAELRSQEEQLTRTQQVRLGFDELLLAAGGKRLGQQNELVEATDGLGDSLDHLLRPLADVELGVRSADEILAEFAQQLGLEAPPTFFDSLLADLKSSILDFDFGGLIVGAFQGGGDVGKTIGAALGNQVGQALSRQLTQSIGGSLGGALGSFLGPLGALGGSLLGGLFDNLGGPSEAELAARGIVEAFEDELIAGLDDSQLAEAAGERWKQVVIAVRDTFIEAGRTGEEGEAAVQRLWDAIKDGGPEAVEAAVASIRAVGAEADAAAAQVEALAAESATDFDAMKAAAEKYGLSVHALGPAFKQARIDDDAAAILADFKLLEGGGANVKKTLTAMADEVQEFLTRARKFGTDVPADMRPMLENMVELGLLTDEDGEKLKDLSGINFSESIEEGVGRVADSMELLVNRLDDLIDRIAGPGGVTRSLEGIPDDITVGVRLDVDASELRDLPVGTAPEFDVGTRLRFERFRRDGQLAILHGEEAVLRRSDVSPLAGEIAAALGPRVSPGGGGGGGTTVVVVNGNDRGRLRGLLSPEALRELDRIMRGGELAVPSSAAGERV